MWRQSDWYAVICPVTYSMMIHNIKIYEDIDWIIFYCHLGSVSRVSCPQDISRKEETSDEAWTAEEGCSKVSKN